MTTAQPTATVSYFIESRPAGTDEQWEQTGLRYSWQDPSKSDEKLASARDRHPEREHRIVTRTTFVTEQPADAASATADQAADREKRYEAGMRRIPGWSSGKVRIRDAAIAAMAVADAESSRLRADLAEAEEDIDGWRAVLRRSDNRNDQLRAEVEQLRADRAAVLREAANGLAVLGPLDSLVSAPAAWTEAIETLRRMADQIAEDELRRKADEAQQAEAGRG